MPYITSGLNSRRPNLRKGERALTAGELNYQIFYYVKHNLISNNSHIKQIKNFVKQFLGENPNYQRYNDMTGVLIRCAKEIKRRLNRNADFLYQIEDSYDNEIAKYEDLKIMQNGDVE